MGNKRLLTLDDLYDYYSSHSRSTHFSVKNGKSPIVVQVPGSLKFDSQNSATDGLLPVVLQSCHIGKNLNQTIIEEDVMKRALPSFSNRPILGYIHKVDDEWQFYKHNLHEGEDGEIEYDEVPVGVVPESCDARLEYDEDKGRTYVVINGYIYEEYSKASEILTRERECAVSVELSIREFSYNAKEQCLVIDDMYFSGVTILGKDPDGNDVEPGMAGSNIKLADFSVKNNSLFENRFNEQIIEIQESLNKLISCFNINNSRKGGVSMSHFEELLSKYNKTAEDITFEYEGLTEEELDTAFSEAFDVLEDEEGTEDGGVAIVSNEIETDEDETNISEEHEAQNESNTDDSGAFSRIYELSHDDIRCALYALLAPVEEADGTEYYIMEVFDDYFVYSDWYSGGKLYGQAYIKNDTAVSFNGERYELFVEFLTASEKAEIEAMRSNYSSMSEKLKAYEDAEAEAKKAELLNDSNYDSVRDSDEFGMLVSDHANIEYDELLSMCDQILLNAIKSGKYTSDSSNAKTIETSKKQFANPKAKRVKPSRYGKLFPKED